MKTILFAVSMCLSSAALAQPYVAISAASVSTTAIGPVRDEKRSGGAVKVAGGYRFGDWAGELAGNVDNNTLVSVAALRWFGPVYLKAGGAYASGSQAVQDPGPVPPIPPGGRPAVDAERARTWSGATWIAGAGAEIHLYKNGGLRLDLERTGRVGELRSATQLSAGLAIHF